MADHKFVTIGGTRYDISRAEISSEKSCDRCGRYVMTSTRAEVASALLGDVPHSVLVELCGECVAAHFPGLVDLAHKVLRHV